MAGELHYSDGDAFAKSAAYWLQHLSNYGCLVAGDFSAVTTYAGLRANIVLHVPPAVHADTIHIIREAVGDGAQRPGELGRANLAGILTDAMVATAAADTGNEITNLITAVAAKYTDQGLVAGASNVFPVTV